MQVSAKTPNNSPKRRARKNRSTSQANGSIGRRIGSQIGGFVGAAAQKMFSNITGFGDYKVKSNTLYNGTDPPMFTAGNRSIVIRHREYLGDILSSTAFVNRTYNIQPSLPDTFPFLSTISSSFEEYRFHGLVFEYKSTSANALNSTNTALGTVVLATEYDVRKPAFPNKLSMENYEFAVSCKPSECCLHPVECDPALQPYKFLFTRVPVSTPVSVDLRTSDMGVFQIATVGMQSDNAVIGELWCTYEIEFIKPKFDSLPNLAPANYYQSNAHLLPIISPTVLSAPVSRDGIAMLGLQGVSSSGNNNLTINNPAYIGTTFDISYGITPTGSTFTGYNYLVNSITNGTLRASIDGPASSAANTGSAGVVKRFQVTMTASPMSIDFVSSGTYSGSNYSTHLTVSAAN